MEFVNYLGDKNVVTFMLLLARMSGLIVFFPFFSHNSIPMVIKSTIVLFLTMYLYPLARLESLHLDSFFVLQLISEVIFGMIAGLMLQIIFAIIMMAGEQIAFTMGFTMASILDPSSAKVTAIDAPIPLLAPVIKTFFPLH
ncbi:flagellar biosynthetic protein FliR, partial [Campylobacter jejuni]|uniref:flagellar biosynthetic protein FliR n=1 Tax=Campylobacter jejuni TaxID=197 RepID=UPI003AF5546E